MDIKDTGDLSYRRWFAVLRAFVDRIDNEQMRSIDGLSDATLDMPAEIAPPETAGNLEHGALDRANSISLLHARRPD
jgi:hypothetical protein